MVYSVEHLSNHPLARAIASDIKSKYAINVKLRASDIEVIQGKGIKAKFQNKAVCIGNLKLMNSLNMKIEKAVLNEMDTMHNGGQTAMLVGYGNTIIGLLSVMDIPRKTVAKTLEKLKSLGIKKMIMLTGDHQNVGDAIAKQIGLNEAIGNLLPEDKVEAIKKLKLNNTKIAMVGDGVNDAPAMAASTVGIAMGAAGSDVALETADVALMSDKIERLPFVIGLSRASRIIIKQNILISLGVVALLVPATIMGLANIAVAVVIHEGSTIMVVINALRLLAYNEPK